MFDNLRDDLSKESYEEPKSAQYQPASPAPTTATVAPRVSRASKSPKILGMTAIQRFVISFMVMMTVLVVGLLILLITGKIAI